MFVYYFVHLPHPREEVERALLDAVEGLPALADVAYRKGEELRARIGVGRGPLAKSVRLHVGAPHRGEAETAVPLTWEATGPSGLFPRMEADLVVAGLGADLTQLALRGSYQPPLAGLGRAIDRALVHRVAEASVKRLVDTLAEAVEASIGLLTERERG